MKNQITLFKVDDEITIARDCCHGRFKKGDKAIISFVDDHNSMPYRTIAGWWLYKDDVDHSSVSPPSNDQELITALEKIRDGAVAYGHQQCLSWIDTAREIATEALNKYKK